MVRSRPWPHGVRGFPLPALWEERARRGKNWKIVATAATAAASVATCSEAPGKHTVVWRGGRVFFFFFPHDYACASGPERASRKPEREGRKTLKIATLSVRLVPCLGVYCVHPRIIATGQALLKNENCAEPRIRPTMFPTWELEVTSRCFPRCHWGVLAPGIVRKSARGLVGRCRSWGSWGSLE